MQIFKENKTLTDDTRKIIRKILLILYGIALPFTLLMAALWPLAVDVAGSIYNFYIIVFCIISTPITIIFAMIRSKKSLRWFLLPFVPVIIFMLSSLLTEKIGNETIIKNDPLIGKEFSFNTPIAYIQEDKNKLTGNLQCINSATVDFNKDINEFNDTHSNLIYVPTSMKFTVEQVSIAHIFGIGDQKYALIKDNNGFESNVSTNQVESKDPCYGEQSSELRKLLEYTEKNGSAYINVLVNQTYTPNHVKSEIDTIVNLFKSKLPLGTDLEKFKYTILKTEGSKIKDDDSVSIEMKVDINTLVFLSLFRYNLYILNIVGLTPNI